MTKLNDAVFKGDIQTAAKLIETYSKQKNKIQVFAEPLSTDAPRGHIEIVIDVTKIEKLD